MAFGWPMRPKKATSKVTLQKVGIDMTNPTSPSSFHARRYDLDWLRVIAFGILIFYHIGMFYVSWGWHVKSAHAGPFAEPLMLIVNPWRLALLFFISGVAVRFASDKAASSGTFAASRAFRLGLPILFGMAVIVAPQSWLELVEKGEFTGGFLEFWPRYLNLEQSFSIVTPTWNHLWYVVYLFVYILLLAPFLPTLRRLANGAGARMINFVAAHPARLLLLTITPFVFYQLVLSPRFPTTHGLFDDWANHAHRLTIFLIGFFVAKHEGFWRGVDRALPAAAALVFVLIFVRPALEGSLPGPIAVFLGVLYAWSFIVMLLGAAQRWLNKPSFALAYLTGAVFCYYILHQTLTAVSGFFLTRTDISVLAEVALVFAMTVGGCVVGYEILRRIPGFRLFFGIRQKPSGKSDKSHQAASSAA